MARNDTRAQSEGVTDASYDPGPDPDGASTLSVALQELRDLLLDDLTDAHATEHLGELTVTVDADALPAALALCRDDARIRCELLSDLSGVHWPGGVVRANDQETTGWPTYTETVEQGTFELLYIMRSVAHNRWFRLRVVVPDDDAAVVPSATSHYSSANFMEREVFDMLGVDFVGHPNLTRILMPEDWDGHPHRKDYPLGGVEVMYKGTTIAPPDEREY